MLANRVSHLKRSIAVPRTCDFSSLVSGTKRTITRASGRSMQRLSLLVFVSTIATTTVSDEASGQTIWGNVVEQGSERPIAAATITLIDEKGAVVATAIADTAGRFVLRPPGAESIGCAHNSSATCQRFHL